MTLRYDQVADLIKIVDASACEELILETAELKLVVRRGGTGGAPAVPPLQAAGSAGPSSAAPVTALAVAPAAKPVIPPPAARASGHEIRAPMVGTFYRAPSPDAPPFVEVGSSIVPGQPLCVIEVMKLFTTIYADETGTIAEIAVGNGELVEFDQVIFVVQT